MQNNKKDKIKQIVNFGPKIEILVDQSLFNKDSKISFQKGRLPPLPKVYTIHSNHTIKAHLIKVNINYFIIMED